MIWNRLSLLSSVIGMVDGKLLGEQYYNLRSVFVCYVNCETIFW